MAGFSDAMRVPEQGAPTGAAPGGAAQDMAVEDGFGEGQEQATEEEQQLLDAFMDSVGDILIPKPGEFNPQVVADLQGDIDAQALKVFAGAEPPVDPKNPQDAIAASAVILMIVVDKKMGYQKKANQEGEDADPSHTAVLWEAGQQLVGMLADMLEKTTGSELSEEDVGNIWLRATDLYRYASPDLDREAMKGQLIDMEEAARSGRLPGVMSGAAAQEQPAGPQPEPANPQPQGV